MKDVGLRLKITQDGVIAGPHTRIWLEGHEITRGVQRVSLQMLVGEVTTAILVVLVNDIEIDADTLALIQARLFPQSEIHEVPT